MIKTIATAIPRSGMSRAAFHHHWRTVHAPLFARIRSLRGYVQSHRLETPIPGLPPAPCEGIASAWFDDLETAINLGRDPDYRSFAAPDDKNFVDRAKISFLFTRENIVVAGASETPGVCAIFLLKRKHGMSVEAFQDYWREKHAPIVPRTPEIRRYVQSHAAPESYAARPPEYDGVAELHWDNLAAFERAWHSPEMQQEQFGDVRHFLDTRATLAFLAEEHRVV